MNTILLYLAGQVMSLLPETRCFGLKRALLRIGGVKIGKNVRICSSVRIIGNGQLIIGDNTWIGPHCLLSVSDHVTIGPECNLAPQCLIVTGSHEIDTVGLSVAGRGYNLPISVGSGSWLCCRSVLLGGCEVGEGTIVAAGAVVKGKFPARIIIGGIPAHIIKAVDGSDV